MKLISHLLDLLFPPKCVFCRRLVDRNDELICPKCKKELPYTENGGILKGNFFTSCVSPLYYENDVREALLRYKFYQLTVYASPFGKMIAECAEEYIEEQVDIISWVPLGKKRLRSRGYDQARLLAEAVSKELGIPCVPVLRKKRDTAPQSRTGSAEKRKKNISGAYEVIDKDLINGKVILLVDDIVTTGSTLAECARTLGKCGADKVYCAAAARKR